MRWICLAVVFVMLLGCGANLSISLPNDHTLVVANSNDVTIVSNHKFGIVVQNSIGSLDTDRDYVFGKIVDPETLHFNEFFVLDTTTSDAAYFATEEEWRSALIRLGVTNIELRGPSAFFNLYDQIWWRVVLFFIAALAVMIPTWLIRRVRKKNLEMHLARMG